MGSYDLVDAATKFCESRGKDIKAFNFGKLKLKVNNQGVRWNYPTTPSEREGPTRIVELENRTSTPGEGSFIIDKQCKPFFKLELTSGIVKGYPYRVLIPGRDNEIVFMAPVNQKISYVPDYTALEADTTVRLAGGSSLKARLSDKTKQYRDTFSCEAHLSGRILGYYQGGSELLYEFSVDDLKDFGIKTTITLCGEICINHQSLHKINVN